MFFVNMIFESELKVHCVILCTVCCIQTSASNAQYQEKNVQLNNVYVISGARTEFNGAHTEIPGTVA